MDTPTPEAVKINIAVKYRELRTVLLELVKLLNILEPGGTLAEDINLTTYEGRVRIAFVATPLSVKISTSEQTLVLRIIDH
ncbi:MAG TPA: hypothetical protein VFT53_00910 [Candidatus Saccharimonadales bacterium]|nr:hypothetical protein [Candidatus Saccharimonadales bacterium]